MTEPMTHKELERIREKWDRRIEVIKLGGGHCEMQAPPEVWEVLDLIEEVHRLRALTPITDEMVERGAEAFYHSRSGEPGPQWDAICADWPEIATVYRRGVRAALEAALGGGES